MQEPKKNIAVLFLVFPEEDGAGRAIESLREMDNAYAISILDAATLVKYSDGHPAVRQESLPSIRKGLGVGALIGGAIGLLFPPSIIGVAAVGAGMGAWGAKIAQDALESEDLREAARALEPGTSALVAVVDADWIAAVKASIAGYERLAVHTLSAESTNLFGALGSTAT